MGRTVCIVDGEREEGDYFNRWGREFIYAMGWVAQGGSNEYGLVVFRLGIHFYSVE